MSHQNFGNIRISSIDHGSSTVAYLVVKKHKAQHLRVEMASTIGFRSTMACFRKARVTIPRLSPTHTKARILRFCPPELSTDSSCYLEITNALFVLECSPDVVTEAFREKLEDGTDVCPLMIVESHDEGDFALDATIRTGEWYGVGERIGTIDDGDDDDDNEEDWLWQAYSHEENDEERELNLPPHIATGKISS